MTLPALPEQAVTPEQVQKRLRPQQREAIRLFTDPLLPTYGNKSASAKGAGYGTTKAFDSPDVMYEIARIEEERSVAGRDVAEYVGTFAWDAARELVQQLSTGRELVLLHPEELLTLKGGEIDRLTTMILELAKDDESEQDRIAALIEGLAAGAVKRADGMVKNNAVYLKAAKERRDAASAILSWKIGSPMSTSRQIVEKRLPDAIDLSDMSDEELEGIGQAVRDVAEMRSRSQEPVVVGIDDVELVD